MKKHLAATLVLFCLSGAAFAEIKAGIGPGMVYSLGSYRIDNSVLSSNDINIAYHNFSTGINGFITSEGPLGLFADINLGIILRTIRTFDSENVSVDEQYSFPGVELSGIIGLSTVFRSYTTYSTPLHIGIGVHLNGCLINSNEVTYTRMTLGIGASVAILFELNTITLKAGLLFAYDFLPIMDDLSVALNSVYGGSINFDSLTLSPAVSFLF